MEPEFFVWFEENQDTITDKFDEIYVEGKEGAVLEDYRVWEDFVHLEYTAYLYETQHKSAELSKSTARQLQEVAWEGQYGTAGF
jgi:hypothetical protein